MTTHRARSHSRHNRAALARPVPAHLAHLHPDWLPPSGYDANGALLDPADDLDMPAQGPSLARIPFPTGLPAGLQPAACPAATDATAPAPSVGAFGERPPASTATPPPATPASGSPLPRTGAGLGERSPYGALPWIPGSSLPPPDPDHPTDEDAIFRNPHHYGSGRERDLSSTALPLRHQIYALHCQGRSISAIARQLCLDRGTVSRHLHAVEDLLLAEQTDDLAHLRLRAVEAQHAILAACWDALLCEELNESDASNDHPYPPRRAQLLATAARAARTAAQLQGLFTPAALAATVGAHGCAPAAATPAPAAAPATTAFARGDYPRSSIAGLSATTPAALQAAFASSVGAHGCAPAAPEGQPASASGSPLPRTGEGLGVGAACPPTTQACQSELPREFNSRKPEPPPRPPTTDTSPHNPAASCGMPASSAPVPPPPDTSPAPPKTGPAASSPAAGAAPSRVLPWRGRLAYGEVAGGAGAGHDARTHATSQHTE